MIVLFYTFVILAACFIVLAYTRWMWTYNQARRKGLLPLEGQATLFDVRNFIEIGEKDLAIYIYSDLYRVGYKKARIAVNELERSLQEKTFE